MSGPIVPGVGKIAVLRANALGDLLFATPALAALRAAYPAAEIVLLAREWHAGFVPGRIESVDRTVAVPPAAGVVPGDGDPAEVERFVASMAAERFDLALQLHGGGRDSNPFVRRLGARVTAGTHSPDAQALDRSVPFLYYQSEVWRMLEVVGLVGALPVPHQLEPRVTVLDRDLEEAAGVAAAGDGGRLVALHPGATDGRRRWPAARFAAVGDALASRGADVVVTGDAEEADLVGEVVATMTAKAQGVAGVLSAGGLAGLLSRCAVVVSNDTGPLHLAAAVGAATVGIFWCGNLITAGPATRRRHRPAISWRLDCPVCATNCITGACDHDASFVADVPLDAVLAPAVDLLAG